MSVEFHEIKEDLPETSFKLVNDFRDELIMIQVLPRLHNSHDRGFDLVAAIFIDLRPGLLRFDFILALEIHRSCDKKRGCLQILLRKEF